MKFAGPCAFAATFAAAIALAQPAPSGAAWLAPAPWLDPQAPVVVTDAPADAAKAVASVPPIDTSDRAAVLAAYNTYYNLPMPSLGYTGSAAGCTAGTISLAFKEWNITRINFMRAMAGVPGTTTLDTSKDAQQQATATLMAANNTINHFPPSNWTCYMQLGTLGSAGAGSSNLAYGGLTDLVQLYMSDFGAGNEAVGHRRWLLHSAKNSFGFGQAVNGNNYNAISVFQSGASVSVPNGIPWPPRGQVPLDLFPSLFTSTQRWSFGYPGANFSAATITVSLNGTPLTVTKLALANGYGDNTVVWDMPTGHTVVKNTTYTVTVAGITGAPQSSYTYTITPFDPADPLPPSTADLALTQAVNANPASTGKDVVFTMNLVNNGPAAASGVTVMASYDPAATVIWATPGCAPAGSGLHSCTVGTLANAATRQFKLVLRKNAAGTIYNNAGVTSTSTDPVPGNNNPTLGLVVNASSAGAQVSRYRLYSPVTKEHLFTTSLAEYNALGALVGTWVQEGAVGKVLDNPGSFNGVAATPYYRLYNASNLQHHWTTDPNEYYTLLLFPQYSGEGVDGYIFPTQAAGTVPLYRLLYPFNVPVAGLHHWTIDAAEYNALIASFGWVGEGGSGFVIP